MGIQDRDWYKEEVRKRENIEQPATGHTIEKSNLGKTAQHKTIEWRPFFAIAIVISASLAAVARDMKDRDVPMSWHGLKWWLSLWFGA